MLMEKVVSRDPGFFNKKFAESVNYFGSKFEARPARRHNKLGVLERKNAVVRLITQHPQ